MSVSAIPAPAWRDRLQLSSNGAIKANLLNACTAVRGIPALGGSIYYDDMRGVTVVERPLPWSQEVDRDWSDHDDNKLTEYLQNAGIGVGTPVASQAVETVAYEQRRHPIREYLTGLTWDRKPRIDQWLTYYLGVRQSRYTAAVGAAWLISAVARVMRPGCKADHVLILEGEQGKGKSSALRALCHREAWFSDSLPPMIGGNKDAMSHLRGVWIIELAELAAMRGQVSIEAVKMFLSRQVDRYRPAYGRREVDVPRQCVFSATTNLDEYMNDPTGNRRFWPVTCAGLDIASIANDRDQLWAEAHARFSAGERWHLVDEDLLADAKDEQAQREEADPWMEPVGAWLSGEPLTWGVTTAEVLEKALGFRAQDMAPADSRRIGPILRKLGLHQKTFRTGSKPQKRWAWREQNEM